MFSDTSPHLADSDFNLITKISQSLGETNFVNETEITLLQKICRSVSNLYAAGVNPPREDDSKNDLLYKVAKSLSESI
jgi:hypothetical protein